MASQGFTAGAQVEQLASFFGPTKRIRANEQAQLLKDLGEYAVAGGRPWLVVVIGHSNKTGIQMVRERVVPWSEFGSWLAPFKPVVLAMLGCEAGSWLPCKALFEAITSLQQIYASPLKLNQAQFPLPILAAILLALGLRKIDDDLRLVAQVVNFFRTGGVVLRRTRTEFKDSGVEEAVGWSFLEVGLDALQKRVFG